MNTSALCTSIIALTAMVAAPSMTAQAADTTLTLACRGTVTVYEYPRGAADAKPEPYSTGITVNLTAHTVQSFGMEYPVKITNINAGTIIFSHSEKPVAPLRPDRPRDWRHGGDDYKLVGRAKERNLKRATLRAEMQANTTDVLMAAYPLGIAYGTCTKF